MSAKERIKALWSQAGHKQDKQARLRLLGADHARKQRTKRLLGRTLALGTLHTSLRETGII